MDSSQPPQDNVALVSYPSNQKSFMCISSTAVFSPQNDCMFASCLQNSLSRYVELNQGALANIFQMSLPKAWLLFRAAEHQNFLETWRMNFCAQLWLSTDLSTLVQALSIFVYG